MRREDGSHEMDESVPKDVRDMLRLLEIEHRGPTQVQQPWSIKKRENGQLEVLGEVPKHIKEQITHMNKTNLRWSPAPRRPPAAPPPSAATVAKRRAEGVLAAVPSALAQAAIA